MADIPADTLMPSGEFKASFCTGTLNIPSGASGTLLTANSSGGRRIRLTMLFPDTGQEPGITITADGTAIISNSQLNQSTNAINNFAIGIMQSGTASYAGNIQHIEAFNTITITKATGSTGRVFVYALEQGF